MKILFLIMYLILTGMICFLKASKIIDQAAVIANKEYTFNCLTSVVWFHSDKDDVEDFLKQFKGAVITIKIGNNFEKDTELLNMTFYKQTVFFATKPDDFEYLLEKMHFVTPIKIIMVLSNQNETNLRAFTEIAWRRDVVDIIILNKDINNDIKVWTYLPYGNGACGNYSPTQLNISPRTYFVKKFKNFFKCPIRVTILNFRPYVKLIVQNNTVSEIGGIEGNLLKLIFERLNSTMDIVVFTDYGVLQDLVNEIRVGSFNDLVHNIADILIPGHIMNTVRYSVAQISHVLHFANIMWCLPNRREIYEWTKVFLPFFNISTSLILAAFLMIYVMIRFSKKFAPVKDESRNDITFRMFGIFFDQDTKFVSSYWLTNSLYLCWIWFSIIVRVSYQGKLIDGLRESILEPRIKTLKEAVNAVDLVSGLPIYLEFYRNTPLEKKYRPMKFLDILPRIQDLAAGERYLLAVDSLQLQFYQQNIQVLDELVISSPACIHMRPRWPAAPYISRLISHIVESGLYFKIENDLRAEWSLLYANLTVTVQLEPMGLETLKSGFYSLMVFYVVSFLILLVEIYWDKRNKKNIK